MRADDTWCTDPNELKEMVLNHFRALYQETSIIDDPNITFSFPRGGRLDEQQVLSVISPVNEDDVRRAIMSMDPFKAPGSDGFQAYFYQNNWEVVGPSICNFVKQAFQTGCFDEQLNETLLCIIPKIDQLERLNLLRPISLCNVVVKIITKIMVNKIRPLLTTIVSPTQSSFLPGRGCNDNILVVQEAMHSLKKCTGMVGNFIMKIDLEKHTIVLIGSF
ncbi:hypothetical protein SLA2020_155070 [Shorea laevis]